MASSNSLNSRRFETPKDHSAAKAGERSGTANRKPLETHMIRTFAIAAILSLTAAAQADELADKVHSAAVKACAVEASASLPAAHYGAITQSCVERISAQAMRKMASANADKTMASTASLG